MSFLTRTHASLWRGVGAFLLVIGMIAIFGGLMSSTANAADEPSPTQVASEADTDGDGIPDSVDRCPDSLPEAEVNDTGCPLQGELVAPVAIDRPGVDNDAIFTEDIVGVRFFLRDGTRLTPGEHIYRGGDTVIVNAYNPEGGSLLGCDCSAEWNLVFTNVGGETPPPVKTPVTPSSPTIEDPYGVDNDFALIPDGGVCVYYTDATGAVLPAGKHPVTTGGPYSITANAAEGCELTGLARYTWPFQFSNEPAPVDVPDTEQPVTKPTPTTQPAKPTPAQPSANNPAPASPSTSASTAPVAPIVADDVPPANTQKVTPGQLGGSMPQSASGVNAGSDSSPYGGLLGLPLVAAGIFLLFGRSRKAAHKK